MPLRPLAHFAAATKSVSGSLLKLAPRHLRARRRWRAGATPILRAPRAHREMPTAKGCAEAVLQRLPLRAADLQLEGVAQEILRPGVFIEPADEIADGVEELLLAAGRRVEQQVARPLEQRAPLVVGHAFEHLELHALARVRRSAPAPARRRRRRDCARRCRAAPRRDSPARIAFVQHALVVRVRLDLGLEGRLRPAAQRGLDALHLHVRAFDDADGDRRAAGRDALRAPIR